LFAPQSEIVGSGLIPPQAETFGGETPAGGITPQDILDAQAFKKFIYLWGWVKYFDVFPDTPEHYDTFLLAYHCRWRPAGFHSKHTGAATHAGHS